ncbi:MAG: Glucosyl-3-phosphoglycerate synthase [Acidimicrobiales bacterium]|nr:MAG: glucosyl-3-phosphoglycerate synthase [Actinomycetota bacterium]MBV6508495.1 Glucosyl-3-phosphoglycerate synthase [Acidimicrobiales bacterium]RIK05219.1 MAG: glucosyl-3-phosphoglycerate synthase [Acidobacteriota bacterium]
MIVPPPGIRSFSHRDFPVATLAEAKGEVSVSVCLPAKNEAATVGRIVATIHEELVAGVAIVDEILVLDDYSEDNTAEVARSAGARVVHAGQVLPEHGRGKGKGEVLWKSLYAAIGEIVVWCDADIREFGSRFVSGTLGPMLLDPEIVFVKGHYRRPVEGSLGGGRVTELVARPLLCLLFPELADIVQPLSGEYGGRRAVLERMPFAQGYGVDIGLLIDIVTDTGVRGIAQVDLEVRHHRNRPLDQLAPQAMAIMQTVLQRADPDLVKTVETLMRPEHPHEIVDVSNRPPLIELDSYSPGRG